MNLMPEEFASEMVSPVYLRTSKVGVLLRQPHPAQQVGVARVRMYSVKLGVGLHERQAVVVPVVSLLQ
jgi:hypothetical protein